MKGRLKPHKAIRFALEIVRCVNTHEIYMFFWNVCPFDKILCTLRLAKCSLKYIILYSHRKNIYSFLAYGSEWQDGSFRCGNTQMCFQIAILCWFSWVQLKQHYEACVCYSWTEQSVQDFFPSCSGDWIIFMSASLSQSFMDIYHQSKLIKHYSIVEFMQNF
jgi:hypothetical protein